MDFLGYILVHKNYISKDNSNNEGSIAATLIAILFYFKAKEYIINNYDKYLLEIIVAFVLTTILIYKYSYLDDRTLASRGFIQLILSAVGPILAILLGLLVFNRIGNTPISYILSNYDISFLFKVILRFIDEVFRITFFIYVQTIIMNILSYHEMKKSKS